VRRKRHTPHESYASRDVAYHVGDGYMNRWQVSQI
jgi:hypothetical protein